MDQRQFEATLADAEIRLRRLRMLYDQWFLGVERVEPRTQRADVDRLIGELRKAQPRNTALRFRFNQLVQRYTTYNTYWQRITRQIEEGTYKRDVLRAKRRFGEKREPEEERGSAQDGYDLDLDIDIEAALEAVRKSEPPIVVGAEAAPPKRASSNPPPSGERVPRALREITPFALPTDGPSVSTPPVPKRRPTQKGPVPVLVAPDAAGVNSRATAPTTTTTAANGAAAPAAPALAGAPATTAASPPARTKPVVAPPPPLGVAGAKSASATVSRKPPPLPSAAPRPAASATAAAHAPSAPSLSEDQIQTIYKRYVDARRNNSERTDNVRIETVAKTVRDMMPKLAQKHAGKRIDFEVVVKDGKVALKPVAK